MKNKLIIGILTLGMVLGSATAFPGHGGNSFYAKAKVVDVEPIYETRRIIVPEESCWREKVVHREGGHRSYTGMIAGGVVGGLVGNQFGKGDKRKVLTVAGTLLGASVGHDLSHRMRRPRVTTERHCETVERVEYEKRLAGYRVKYRFKGNVFVTHTDHHPGKHIQVRVSVDPATS